MNDIWTAIRFAIVFIIITVVAAIVVTLVILGIAALFVIIGMGLSAIGAVL